mgnify:CR=1 FL=1
MKKVFTGYASKKALKTARWVRNKVYFKGLEDVLRMPVIGKKQNKGKIKYTVTIETV